MPKPNALHHLAISTADIKAQIDYFTDVLGMELVALYWMHGVENTFHGFMKLSNSSSIAFVQHPDIAKIEPIPGVSHAGTTAGNVAPGEQHRAPVGRHQACQHVEHGRLPGAVGTDEAVQRPGPDVEIDVLGNNQRAEALVEIAHRQDRPYCRGAGLLLR